MMMPGVLHWNLTRVQRMLDTECFARLISELREALSARSGISSRKSTLCSTECSAHEYMLQQLTSVAQMHIPACFFKFEGINLGTVLPLLPKKLPDNPDAVMNDMRNKDKSRLVLGLEHWKGLEDLVRSVADPIAAALQLKVAGMSLLFNGSEFQITHYDYDQIRCTSAMQEGKRVPWTLWINLAGGGHLLFEDVDRTVFVPLYSIGAAALFHCTVAHAGGKHGGSGGVPKPSMLEDFPYSHARAHIYFEAVELEDPKQSLRADDKGDTFLWGVQPSVLPSYKYMAELPVLSMQEAVIPLEFLKKLLGSHLKVDLL